MRKIRYFIIEDEDTLTAELMVPDNATDAEIDALVLEEVAIRVTSNKWSVDWEDVA